MDSGREQSGPSNNFNSKHCHATLLDNEPGLRLT